MAIKKKLRLVHYPCTLHSRRDQRYIATRSTSRTRRISQGCLNESATFAVKSTFPWRIKSIFYNRSLRTMALACLQVTAQNPTDQQDQLSIKHIDQATYAMADKRGPLDTKFCPVESTLGPWIRVGYESRLNTVTPLNTFVTYSTKAASSNSFVSERG